MTAHSPPQPPPTHFPTLTSPFALLNTSVRQRPRIWLRIVRQLLERLSSESVPRQRKEASTCTASLAHQALGQSPSMSPLSQYLLQAFLRTPISLATPRIQQATSLQVITGSRASFGRTISS